LYLKEKIQKGKKEHKKSSICLKKSMPTRVQLTAFPSSPMEETACPRGRIPLTALSPNAVEEPVQTRPGGYKLGGAVNLILWFVIVAVIAWIILWIWKPVIVQQMVNGQPTGTPDGGKTLIGAIIIALIVVIIIWLVSACR
jgi:hypothetical protein